MHTNLLQMTILRTGEAVVVKLIGEARLDVEGAELQLDRVAVQRPKLVVVDCSELTFMSSIGMRLLVNLRRAVGKHGGVVRLAALQPLVAGSLQHARLFEILPAFADVATAIAEPIPASSATS